MDPTANDIPVDPSKPKVSLTPLKERASQTAKVLWTGVGALATLGGVVGLLQVFSAGNSANLHEGASSQDVLMEMVSRGDIDVADAERLAELLYGANGAADTQGLQDIVESGSDRQKKALALLAERHTREEGLDILESEAKTGEDWRLVAELSSSFDAKRSLAAVKKAIALNPDDFQAVTLMSQAQANVGDYASAQRSAKTAEMLASTTLERVMASRSSVSILLSGQNVTDLPAGIESLKSALLDFEPDVETTPLPIRLGKKDIDRHPMYVRAGVNETLASASLYLADAGLAQHHAELAIADLHKIANRVEAGDAAKIQRRIASAYDNPIYAQYAKKNWPEVMRLAKAQLDVHREIAESGDKKGQAALSSHYARYASYGMYAGETDIVRSASARSVSLAQLAVDRRPDDVRLALDLVEAELRDAVALSTIGDEVNLAGSLDKMMTKLEDVLRDQPDQAEDSPWNRYSGLIVGLTSLFNQDQFKTVDNPIDELLARSENYLDDVIGSRPDAHDPRHARNTLYITIGDQFSANENLEKARESYRRAYDDSIDIPPTEKEPDVVELSKLLALFKLVDLKEEGVKSTDRPEFKQALDLAQRLDQEGKLVTMFQPILSYLIATRDGTMPDYEAMDGSK